MAKDTAQKHGIFIWLVTQVKMAAALPYDYLQLLGKWYKGQLCQIRWPSMKTLDQRWVVYNAIQLGFIVILNTATEPEYIASKT